MCFVCCANVCVFQHVETMCPCLCDYVSIHYANMGYMLMCLCAYIYILYVFVRYVYMLCVCIFVNIGSTWVWVCKQGIYVFV